MLETFEKRKKMVIQEAQFEKRQLVFFSEKMPQFLTEMNKNFKIFNISMRVLSNFRQTWWLKSADLKYA